MADVRIEAVPCVSDNYAWLVHDTATGCTAVVDPSEAAPVQRALARHPWHLTHVLNTHHHWDHTGGNADLRAGTGAEVLCPEAERDRVESADRTVRDGEVVLIGEAQAQVVALPGHTRGAVAWWLAEAGAVFVGDTLFSLGCGRLFEGTAEQMWSSLERLRALPPDTLVCCGHEYTEANARFALSVDPDNPALLRRVEEVRRLRASGRPTVPTRLAEELAANPFLRADDAALAERLGLAGAPPARVFAELRRRKDVF